MNLGRTSSMTVALVDDDEGLLDAAATMLRVAGFKNLRTTTDGHDAISWVDSGEISAAVIDLMMPSISGQQLLEYFAEHHPAVPVIIVTAVDDVDSAVDAVRAGAFDYIVKPVETRRLITSLTRALSHRALHEENQALRNGREPGALKDPAIFDEVVTRDKTMLGVFRYIEATAPSEKPVLVSGETGVGKELIARAIHRASGLQGEFVVVNAAGVDDAMFSDMLFGHRKGAFTGADSHREGLVQRASEGTLFLDEIGDLAVPSQVKLLRLLQDGSYYAGGSDTPTRANVRVVAATNVAPEDMRSGKQLRKDLYYRLQAHHVRIPPLRERLGDLPILLDHFLTLASEKMSRLVPTVPPELFPLLESYRWPGNVREFEGMVFDAVADHQGGVLSLRRFYDGMGLSDDNDRGESTTATSSVRFGPELPSLTQIEALLIDEALARADGNQTLAARLLGLSRQALNNRIRRRRGD